MEQLKQKLNELKSRLNSIANDADLEKKKDKVRSLEEKTLADNFWSDTNFAQTTMRELSALKEEVEKIQSLKSNLETLLGLLELEKADQNPELDFETEKIETEVEKLENLSFLSGQYDSGDALISIHSGQGGVEAMDWAAMLLRMYLRYATNQGWKTELIEETKGEEAGIKSATVEIQGFQAYGLLKKEAGAHRLVRLSPFNADALRQTSFALVEVMPVIAEAAKKAVNQDEIEMETFRSSGPGGQNVQKVNTAVRLRHKKTGLIVTAQSERSQLQNRENAMKILSAKLYLLEEAERAKEERQLKGEFKIAGWGNQIRSYVLQPYKQVKDVRSGFVSNDPEDVLGGNLDGFISAELKL